MSALLPPSTSDDSRIREKRKRWFLRPRRRGAATEGRLQRGRLGVAERLAQLRLRAASQRLQQFIDLRAIGDQGDRRATPRDRGPQTLGELVRLALGVGRCADLGAGQATDEK